MAISSVELAKSSAHLPISSDDLAKSSAHLAISSAHLAISLDDLAKSSAHLAISSAHLAMSSAHLSKSLGQRSAKSSGQRSSRQKSAIYCTCACRLATPASFMVKFFYSFFQSLPIMAQLPVEEIASAVSGAVTFVLSKIEASGSNRVAAYHDPGSDSEDFEPPTKKKNRREEESV